MQEFIKKIIEYIIGNIPSIAILLTLLKVNMEKISKIPKLFNESKEEQKSELKNFRKDIDVILKQVEKEVGVIIKDAVKEISENVVSELTGMKKELGKYNVSLLDTKAQSENLNVFNTIYMQVISKLLGKDFEKIENGIAQIVQSEFFEKKKDLDDISDEVIGVIINENREEEKL